MGAQTKVQTFNLFLPLRVYFYESSTCPLSTTVDGLDNVDSVDRMCFPDLLGNCQINVQEFMPNIMQDLLQFCDLVI